jgi:hypothetical protein
MQPRYLVFEFLASLFCFDSILVYTLLAVPKGTIFFQNDAIIELPVSSDEAAISQKGKFCFFYVPLP